MKPNNNFRMLDEILAQHGIIPLSLNPHKNFATSFVELGSLATEITRDTIVIKATSNSLKNIVYAQLVNFPENIFWDFDFLVRSILTQALSANGGAIRFLERFTEKIVNLLNIFGNRGIIRFRYVHDFMYGFDWAKWVSKEPDTRAVTDPFCVSFLDYLSNRGKEIIQLISANDSKYHPVSSSSYRNPFAFCREPESERRLLKYMAEEELIPVAAWDWNTRTVWDKSFQDIRQELSAQLNITKQIQF